MTPLTYLNSVPVQSKLDSCIQVIVALVTHVNSNSRLDNVHGSSQYSSLLQGSGSQSDGTLLTGLQQSGLEKQGGHPIFEPLSSGLNYTAKCSSYIGVVDL